jgi:glutathione S-transferase
MSQLTLVGRSSSHYTRVTRIFAHELGATYTFRPVLDMATIDAPNYGDNPALKVPVLIDERGPLFGAENICRELTRRSSRASKVVLRGDSSHRLVANAEELTLHAMASEVAFITAKLAGDARLVGPKVSPSLDHCIRYLDQNIGETLAALPSDRVLSFVEVALFCTVTHFPFRQTIDVSAWKNLGAFCTEFGQRESARATEYRFDSA